MRVSYRRPGTTDPEDFWYLDKDEYDELIRQLLREKARGKGASNNMVLKRAQTKLRRHEIAGLIMETDQGIDAPVPCEACTRRGCACRILKDSPADKACALCKCYFKSGCRAGVVGGERSTSPAGEGVVALAPNTAAFRSAELDGLGISTGPPDTNSIVDNSVAAITIQHTERLCAGVERWNNGLYNQRQQMRDILQCLYHLEEALCQSLRPMPRNYPGER